MNPVLRLIALCVGVLLLATPTAFGCAGPGTMSADCPMVGMESMTEMAGSPCHESAPMPDDCCDLEPAPEPIQAPSCETAKLTIELDAADLPASATMMPPVRLTAQAIADAPPEHDIGLYTLFSSLLL